MVGDIPLRCLLLKKDEEFGGYSSSCRIHPGTGMKGTGSYQLGVIIAYYSLPPKHASFLWYSNFGLSDFTVVKSCRLIVVLQCINWYRCPPPAQSAADVATISSSSAPPCA